MWPFAKIASNAARTACGPTTRAPPGMHADDVVVVGPDGHHAVEVAVAQRVVELGFGVLGRGVQRGRAGFRIGHASTSWLS